MGAWTVIDHNVVGYGGTSSYEITDIPDSYGALWIEVTGRGEASTTYGNFFVRFTQGSGSNPTWDSSSDQYINAVMSTGGGNSGSGSVYVHKDSKFYHLMYMPGSATANSTHKGTAFFTIPGYADSLKYKTVLGQCHIEDSGNMPMFLVIGTWRETSAIKGIQIFPWSGDISEYTSITLYGLETQIGS